MNVMINHVNICPDNDNLHADHNYSNYTGPPPPATHIGAERENKPVLSLLAPRYKYTDRFNRE